MRPHPRFVPLTLVAVMLLGALGAGCANPLRPYRMEIQQGNNVTQDMVSQLKVGMTKDQVRFALGTPLINDIFHQDRWDYIYTRRRSQARETEQRGLTVFFDQNGRLVRVDGDVVPGADTSALKE